MTATTVAEPALTISCQDPLFAKDSTHERLVEASGNQNVALVPHSQRSLVHPKL
jgi:hypothetical protein